MVRGPKRAPVRPSDWEGVGWMLEARATGEAGALARIEMSARIELMRMRDCMTGRELLYPDSCKCDALKSLRVRYELA